MDRLKGILGELKNEAEILDQAIIEFLLISDIMSQKMFKDSQELPTVRNVDQEGHLLDHPKVIEAFHQEIKLKK